MKWLVLGLFAASVGLFVCSARAQKAGRSADERLGSIIPATLGALLLCLDVLIVVGWGLARLLLT